MGGWQWRSCWQVRINYERKAERGMVLLGVSLIHAHSATRTHLHPHIWAQVAAQTLSLSHTHTHFTWDCVEETRKNKRHPNLIFRCNPFLFPSFFFPFICFHSLKIRREGESTKKDYPSRVDHESRCGAKKEEEEEEERQDLDNISHPHPLFVTGFLRSQVRKEREWREE